MMKRLASFVVVWSALALLAGAACAQPEGGRPGPDRPGPDRAGPGARGERNRGRRGGEGRRPPSPLVAALDADRDGILSAKEIENAVAALKRLDKNGDGRLTPDELRPQGGPPRQRGGGSGDFVDRMLQNDQNNDGKLSKEELPERMRQNFGRIDSNNDGSLDRSELEALAQRFRQGRGGRGRRGAPGDRPERPLRPELDP